MAVHVGASIESWEHHNQMAAHNITVVAPGGGNVVAVGSWISVAGHSVLTSKYSLGADQVLSINVVTADGHFLTIDPNNHEELWWALRGGGPSEYSLSRTQNSHSLTCPGIFGVITSVILKAYPAINITRTTLTFTVNPSLPPNTTVTPSSLTDPTSFWRGVSLVYHYCPHIIAAGGFCYSYIYPLGNASFTFTSTQTVPNITAPALIGRQ
jgi:hypothetical protein